MVIVKLIGGLGNQMFQYAAAKALALHTKQELRLDLSGFDDYKLRAFDLHHFNINAKPFRQKSKWIRKLENKLKLTTYYNELSFRFNPEVFSITTKNIQLQGYFQAEDYFITYRNDILNDFKIVSLLKKQTQNLLVEMSKTNAVSIHIRRGDFLTHEVHNTSKEEYYREGMIVIENKIEQPESCIGHPTAMIRAFTLKHQKIKYDTAYEPAEDYDLWVRLSQVGQLHNLQEVLFLYRVHDDQVSITKKEIQRKSPSLSRFNMLSQLDFDYSELEKQAYIKQFSCTERLNYQELKALLKLNKKAIKANNNTYFNQKDFIALLNQFEAESLKQYFVGNKSFNPLMIVQYLSIFKTSNFKLSTQAFLKLMAKSILFYKSK